MSAGCRRVGGLSLAAEKLLFQLQGTCGGEAGATCRARAARGEFLKAGGGGRGRLEREAQSWGSKRRRQGAASNSSAQRGEAPAKRQARKQALPKL